jgi:hypothetical protein
VPTISTGNPRTQATTKQLVDPGRLGNFGVQFTREKAELRLVDRKRKDRRRVSCKTRFLKAVDCVPQEFVSIFLPPFPHMFSDDYMKASIRLCITKTTISKPFRLSVITKGGNGFPPYALTAVCLRLHVMQKDGEMRPTRNSSTRKSLSMRPRHTSILLVLQKKSKKWWSV